MKTATIEMNTREKYHALPGSRAGLPDRVYMVVAIEEQIAELDRQRAALVEEAQRETARMMEYLREHWTEEELREAGLL